MANDGNSAYPVRRWRTSSGTRLFVDSDMPRVDINRWFEKVETENPARRFLIPDGQKQNIYFMIQEMEAWFLKQPQCFEVWAKNEGWTRRNPAEKIEEHSLLRGKNVEDIAKPSVATATILKHFFEKRTKGEKRKLAVYGKLTTAPSLLDKLDVSSLELCDSELHRFKINESVSL